MKRLFLSKEDTKAVLEDHDYITVDIYIIFGTSLGWEWAINPDDAYRYDPEYDELDCYAELNADVTEVVDIDDDEDDDDF